MGRRGEGWWWWWCAGAAAAAGVVRVCGIVLRASTVLAETVAAGPRSRPLPRPRPRARAVLGEG